MNGFGPVILDFPYAFELDGAKLQCRKLINTPNGLQPCGGEIDYDAGFDYLVCTKCGRKYQARDLAANTKDVLIINDKGGEPIMSKVRLVAYENGKKKIILDDNTSSKNYISKEEYDQYNNDGKMPEVVEVSKINKRRRLSREKKMDLTYNNFMIKKLNKESDLNYRPFSQLLPSVVEVDHSTKNEDNESDCDIELHNRKVVSVPIKGYDYQVEDTIKETESVDNEENTTDENVDPVVDEQLDRICKSLFTNDDTTVKDIAKYAVENNMEVDIKLTPRKEDNEEAQHDEEQDEEPLDLSGLGTNFIGSKVEVEEQDYSNYEPEEESNDSDDIESTETDEVYTFENYLSDRNKKHNTKFKTNKLEESDMDNY